MVPLNILATYFEFIFKIGLGDYFIALYKAT